MFRTTVDQNSTDPSKPCHNAAKDQKKNNHTTFFFFLTACRNGEKACYTEEEIDFTYLQEASWLIKACPFCKASAVQSLISLCNSSCLAAKTGRLKPSDLRSLR